MDISTVRGLLRNGESEVVEAKADARNVEELQRTACAMSNTKGGHIVVGVEERINPVGEEERFRFNGLLETRGTHRTLEQVGSSLRPTIKVEIDRIATEKNRAIFVIGVPKRSGSEMVSLANGDVYQRSGSEDVKAGIFKPKTASEEHSRQKHHEEIAVLEGLFSIKSDLVRAGEIAELTGINLGRIEGHLENLAKQGLFRKTIRTSSGLMAEVTAGDRLQIENRLNELRAASEKPETENQFGSPSTGLGPPESEASPSATESQAEASDKLELKDQVDVEIVRSEPDSADKDDESLLEIQSSESRSEASPVNARLDVTEGDDVLESKASTTTDRDGNPIVDRAGQPITANADIQLEGVTTSNATPTEAGNSVQIRREAKTPTLNAKEYGEVVAGLLAASPDSEAMTFALFGPWGRGKTFQMKQIAAALNRVENGPTYKSVWFSAWKYRSTPETWAYLFQCLLRASRADSRAIPWRAAFLKTGPALALFAMFGLMVSLIPNGGTSGLGFQLVQLLGFGSVVYLVTILLKFRSAGIRIARAYSPMDHSEKLGMQAAIGDDIRFLQAWMPKPVASRSCWAKTFIGFQILVYLVLAIAIAGQLFLFKTAEEKFEIPLIGEVATHIHPYVSLIPLLLWIVIAVVAPAVIFWPQSKANPVRSLLIIDDLDRCDPLQMLDVIESTLLILDDPEIKSRLQIAILVDDFAFRQALSKKYDLLLSVKDEQTGESNFGVPRLVRENQEKFFLLQLRLPKLQPKDIEPVVTALSDEMVAKPETGTEDVVIPDDALTTEDGSHIVVETEEGESELVVEAEEEISVDVILHRHERDQLASCIAQILGENDSLTLGPRSTAYYTDTKWGERS